MDYLCSQQDFDYNFGLDVGVEGIVIGKMFGVLVVQDRVGEIGYLQVFFGKVVDSNYYSGFVLLVFDMLIEGSFFLEGEKVIYWLILEIEVLEVDFLFLEVCLWVNELEQ